MKASSSQPDQAAREVWSHVLERAKRDLSPSTFHMWFGGLRPAGFDGERLRVLAPSDLVRDKLAQHYRELIRLSASEAAGGEVQVELSVDPEGRRGARPRDGHLGAETRPGATEPTAAPEHEPPPGIPAGYTFETFVPGPSNRFAHAAAMAVAETKPSKAYNPVFIYGGVGLGKTHLLYAIGHHATRLDPRLRVKYVTSETFMAEFIKAIRERQGYQFAARYRDVDILLIDDIQFLAKREETQIEFFHTFNALHAKERQIVIASDRPPQELSGMDERLRSRFRLGLCVDVQPPDLETRIAILQLKAGREQVEVPEDVLEFIASKFDQNIRELEGALLRVAAFASFSRQAIVASLAEKVLADLLPQSDGEIPVELIMGEVSAHFGLTPADLISKSRSRPLTTARHIAMYLLREQNGLSLIRIGEWFHRDHTTVMHGIRKVEQMMRARGSTYLQVQELTKKVRARARSA